MYSAYQISRVTFVSRGLPRREKPAGRIGIDPIGRRFQEGIGLPDIRINKLKNRLYIFLQDWIPTEMPVFVRKLELACLALIPGFTCLAVIPPSGLDHRRDRDLLGNTTDLISVYGARKVVCVKAAGDRLSHQLSSIQIAFQSRIPVKQAADLKEAEDLLNG